MTKEKTLYEKLTETYDLFVISDEGIKKIEKDLKQTLKEAMNEIEKLEGGINYEEGELDLKIWMNDVVKIIKQKFGEDLLK